LVGVGEGVEVFLGGGDLSMTHAVHHGSEVGAAGQQPGGVGVTQVVDADGEVQPGGGDGGSPDAGAEGAAGEGGAVAGGEQQVVWLELPFGDVVGELFDEVGWEAEGAGFVVSVTQRSVSAGVGKGSVMAVLNALVLRAWQRAVGTRCGGAPENGGRDHPAAALGKISSSSMRGL
jgi:hypothetical protein